MAGPVTDGKATGAKKEPHYSVADRMNRIPTSPHTTLIIFFVLMGWFAETIDLGGTSFLMPTIREYFGMDATTGGYYSSICFLGMFIGAIAAGRIADKVGRKKTFLIAGLCTSIFGIAYGASTTLVMLIITGILYQFGKYLNAMMMALYTPELYETSIRTTGNGLATSWGRMGSIIGPIVLAGVMTSFGVYTTMYIAAAMVIIPGLLVFLIGPETKDKKF